MTTHTDALFVARILAILGLVTLMRSPALANLFLALLLATSFASPVIRRRLLSVWQQPMAKGAVLLLVWMALGIVYSVSGWQEGLKQLWAWRIVLFMLLAAALFDIPRWKRNALRFFSGVTTLGAAAVLLLSIQQSLVSGHLSPTPVTLFRNYATQGMTFTTALVACGCLLFIERGRIRFLWMASAVLLLVATTVTTEGRSGYVILLVSGAAFALGALLQKGMTRTRATAGALAMVALGLILVAASPVARQRIDVAVTEMRNYEAQGQVGTSMGLRMYFWQDALTLISDRPIFGSGTGSYPKVQGELVVARNGAAGMRTADPHNQYLKIAAENGILGLGIFLIFLISLTRQSPSAPYRIAGLAVLAGWCATSLANAHFSTFTEGHLLGLFLGITLAAERGEDAVG